MEEIILTSLKKYEDLLNRIDSKIEGQKKVLTLDEAATYAGFSKSYMYKLTSQGIIEFSKPNGKTIFFDREILENWLLSRKSKDKAEIEKAALTFCTLSNKKGGQHGTK